MATERKPWPAWAANDYYMFLQDARQIRTDVREAFEIQHRNVYKTTRLLAQILLAGQDLASRVRELKIRKAGDSRWPDWANDAIEIITESARYITAGAKHGLSGIIPPTNEWELFIRQQGVSHHQDNWKMVVKGLRTCAEHSHKIEMAMLAGPEPIIPLSDDLQRTLDMGRTIKNLTGGGSWKENKRRKE